MASLYSPMSRSKLKDERRQESDQCRGCDGCPAKQGQGAGTTRNTHTPRVNVLVVDVGDGVLALKLGDFCQARAQLLGFFQVTGQAAQSDGCPQEEEKIRVRLPTGHEEGRTREKTHGRSGRGDQEKEKKKEGVNRHFSSNLAWQVVSFCSREKLDWSTDSKLHTTSNKARREPNESGTMSTTTPKKKTEKKRKRRIR